MTIRKYYTMIGHRSTPPDVCKLMESIAQELYVLGYNGRSGGARGADQAIEDGHTDNGVVKNVNVYLPWNNFNKKSSKVKGYINSPTLPTYEKAKLIACGVHPAWDNCDKISKAFHTRNVFQILGASLNSPSDFVICYAEPIDDLGNVKGGTGIAVRIAINRGIPVYNLWEIEVTDVCKFVADILEDIKND